MSEHTRILATDGVHCRCGWQAVTDDRARAFGEHLDWLHVLKTPVVTQLTSQLHELMCDQHMVFADFVERTGWSVRTCEQFLSGNYDPNLREVATAGHAFGTRFDINIYDTHTGEPAPFTVDDVLDEIERQDAGFG